MHKIMNITLPKENQIEEYRPPIQVQKRILNLISAERDKEALTLAQKSLEQFPKSLFLHNANGSILQS